MCPAAFTLQLPDLTSLFLACEWRQLQLAPGAERGVSGHLGRALSLGQSKQCGLAAATYVIFSPRNTGRTQCRPPSWTTRGWGQGLGPACLHPRNRPRPGTWA